MSKKAKKSLSKRPLAKKGWLVSPRQIEDWLRQASNQLVEGKHNQVITTCQRILRVAPPDATTMRAEALQYLGAAQAMLQNYYDSYDAFTQALAFTPDDPRLWYNRGMTCRFVGRMGQSQRDLELALELESPDNKLAGRMAEDLKVSRDFAEQSRALRGTDFTLDQLIEQEGYFHEAMNLMASRCWAEGEELFRRVIAMGDCLPQPWGNLGVCLMMRERYDEAEVALRRALELDPEYEHARRNLDAALETKRTGQKPVMGGITEPFKDKKIKQAIVFEKE